MTFAARTLQGVVGEQVEIPASFTVSGVSSPTGYGGVRFGSDGSLKTRLDNTAYGVNPIATSDDKWLEYGDASDFVIYATKDSGIDPTVNAGFLTELPLSTSRVWEMQSSVGLRTCQITFEIRRASDSSVVATTVVTLEADNAA